LRVQYLELDYGYSWAKSIFEVPEYYAVANVQFGRNVAEIEREFVA
jgi:hypothetical protein